MKTKRIIAVFLGLVTTLGIASCKKKYTPREDAGSLGYLFTQYEGFAYEEASVLEESDRVIVSYTTNKTENTQDNVIAVRTGTKTATGYEFSSEPVIAVEPSENGWDTQNIGGSDLIKGKFNYDGTEYKYMMAYHANNVTQRKRLQVGLAVSNDLKSWKKVGNEPIVGYDYETYGDTDGVCNPSLVNLNGESNVLIFYSYASSRITESRFVEAKLSSLDTPVLSGNISVPHKGLPLDGLEWATVINADFAYDSQEQELYMVKDGMVFATQNAKKATLVQLAKIPFANVYKQEATWTQIATVMGLEAGGYTRMHSAAIVANEYAQTLSGGLSIVFTSSVGAKGIDDISYLYKSGLHYYTVSTGENA